MADKEPVVELEVDRDEMIVRRWRQERLERGGFSEFTAFRLSMRFDIDCDRAISLFAKALPKLGPEKADVWAADQLLD